ncbi:E3 ubiquitin-protein ligase TRIM31 [Echinops telfairi]|uniref:E3 ubiquitin-protein ligase TRIM31 n=1 Tax=Echinops telfairi TaxID=9371 RepID=A0AC55DSD1_ECHTE|nr:E3 ubiquitin-protein ligase TRIM31 [Echinops telfairi]
MASSPDFTKFQEQVICPICLEIFQNPVTIDCGHNFCLKCITATVDTSGSLLKCPLCKHSVGKDTLKTNWVLMNLVEMIQEMRPREEQPGRGERKCQKHKEQLHYFCETDGNFLCIVCRESKEHKLHKVILMEEAAQKYLELVNSQLEVLQQKQKVIMQVKTQGKQKIHDFMAQVEQEMGRVTAEFKQLFQVLQEEEKALLSRLEELGQEGDQASQLYITSIDAQLTFLNRFVQSLEAKKQMAPSDLLWDIRYDLNRSQGFQFLSPTPVPLDLEKKLGEAKSRHNSVLESMKKCRAPVTFDATSAHPDLILSQDLKTVTLNAVSSENSEAPDDPARFYPFRCVVGSPGLSRGCQAWEAELRGPGGGACVVGVASEFAARRDFLTLEPAAGFWVLRVSGRQCQALLEGDTRKDLRARPSRLGVSVDHERGEVAFHDAATAEHIYTFHASFPGQIFPFFRLLFPGTQITLRPWSRP